MDTSKMQQVDLGFVKFQVTRQAIISYVLAICFMLLSMGISLIPLYKMGFISTGVLMAICIFFVCIFILYGILVGYTINCLVVGKCIKLSWVFVGLYGVITLLYFIVFITTIMKGSSK